MSQATHPLAADLLQHYLAARDSADCELTIAYLELMLSCTMRRLPNLTRQEAALAELLRRRGDRVVLNRATSTIRVALTDQPVSDAPVEQSPDVSARG
jgi:hypothetical protein